MHQNLMSRWDEVVHKMEQVQAKQQPTPTSPKASPHTSSSNLKEPTTPGSSASPTAAREWAEQSPKRDEDQRDRRNSRASESGSESGAHPALPHLSSPLAHPMFSYIDSASERKKKVFAERRKAHYNEFQVLKKIGKDLNLEEEEDARLAAALAASAGLEPGAARPPRHTDAQHGKRTPAAATATSVPCSSPGRADEHMADT